MRFQRRNSIQSCLQLYRSFWSFCCSNSCFALQFSFTISNCPLLIIQTVPLRLTNHMMTKNIRPIVVMVLKNGESISMLNINMLVISVPVGKTMAFHVGVQLSCLLAAYSPIHQNAVSSHTNPNPLSIIAISTHAASSEAAAVPLW